MSIPMTATEILDREFLAVRAKLIDVAAMLDRMDRGEPPTQHDFRIDQIRRTLEILATDEPNRAEQLQLVFSIPYEENWQAQ